MIVLLLNFKSLHLNFSLITINTTTSIESCNANPGNEWFFDDYTCSPNLLRNIKRGSRRVGKIHINILFIC